MKRPAVIDAHHRGLAVFEVGDAHITRNRQRLVCGGHREHVVWLAAGGLAALEFLAVPRRATALLEAVRIVEHVVDDAKGFVLRSEERRVGKECVSTCRSRWWRYI